MPGPKRTQPVQRMKVSFELGPEDLRTFRERLRRARDRSDSDHAVIRRAAGLVQRARAAKPPEFVVERIDKLDQLTLMLLDDEWQLEGADRDRILDALAYFADPDDLIPDRVPGIGYLDDAIMVELVVRELRHELEAYEDFCVWRRERPAVCDAPRRQSRRRSLQARMRRRQRRDRDGTGPGSRRPPTPGLW